MRAVVRSLVVVLVAASVGWNLPARGQTPAFFEDHFNGAHVDASKWRIGELVEGKRWCDPNPGFAEGPGAWVDPLSEPCYGVTQAPPYGNAAVESGLLRLSPSAGSRAFPYLSSRVPEGVAPFPAIGDFTFTVSMGYDHRGGYGNGITVMQWPNTAPNNDNAPGRKGDVIFQVVADPDIRLFSCVSGSFERIPVTLQQPDAFHEYSIRSEGGAYSVVVDGAVVYGPFITSARPAAIWIGNPVLTYWGVGDWSAFSIDFIRVDVPEPTPADQDTWGSVKARYRD